MSGAHIAGAGGSGGDQIPDDGDDGDILTKNSGDPLGYSWEPNAGGGGGGAPTSATYLTLTANGTLTNERTLVDDGATIQLTDAGANSTATLSVRDNGISLAKLADVATDTLLGRASAGPGDPETIACTAAGRALLDDADASAQRTTLGLGTLATQNGTFSGTHSGSSSGTNTGDQTNISGNAATATLAATVTTNANLTGPITSVGNATTIADPELAALAALTSAADRLPYFTGSGTASLATFTSFARTILDDGDAATVRATIGAGTGSGTLGGSTGATDNQLLRSDGTGGATAQASGVTLDDANGIAGHTEVPNSQAGPTYTTQASDCGKVLYFTGACVVTIPASTAANWHCRWEQRGSGAVSFNGNAVTAATLRNRQSHTSSAGQYAVGGLAASATGDVTLFGDTA